AIILNNTVSATNGNSLIQVQNAGATVLDILPEALDLKSQGLSFELANAGTTGTTANKLVKLTGAPSTAVIATTSDTSGVIGICTASNASNCGTSGSPQILIDGKASCVFDGATTAGDYVVASTTVGGDCHDSGATQPTVQIIGRVLSTNGGGGTYTIALRPQELTALSTPISVTNGGTGTGSTLTGLVRGNASAMTAAELSGDATTS